MMSPWCVLLMCVCLQSGPVCRAVPEVQTLNLRVQYGEMAILPCNGSAYLGEEGNVYWETSLGVEVASLRIGEETEGERTEFVAELPSEMELPSEEQIQRGDWSLRIRSTKLLDSATYQCIWEGQRPGIVSTVWLSVKEPPTERHLLSSEGETVTMKCFLQISWSQFHSGVESWWTRDGERLLQAWPEATPSSDSLLRFSTPFVSVEEHHLQISPTLRTDGGEYRCWYRIGDSESPRTGSPNRITLTILDTVSAGPDAELLTVSRSGSDAELSTVPPEEEDSVSSTPDVVPVFLEDSTQPSQETTESQPMEALKETMTSLPGGEESVLQEEVPWIRIGLIAGVLVVTALVLSVLKALQRI
ncbi:uncharacterized protein LOC117808058 [Notolabrus celidotus]|uniref:uncharacterized protein LOC117808058 n=1 Tax=Notolabrus celidotus TaxID=1203425 RepID=UPI0014901134|nr:uncharacterized protein LOC117808058 [Notolabrus celidotus]XP_034533388.1 uncharacterized protein LOC117808058 [Notolabrus celidotus]